MPKQQLGLTGAIAIGLASMLGAGLFVVFRDVAATAGSLQYYSLLLAAIVATLNAASIYQLAKSQSRAGGVYAYSRIYISKPVSFVAGFSFVFGKVGSIAAVGLVFEEYVLPGQHGFVATSAIVLLTGINLLGINRTALVAGILSAITTAFLVFTVYQSGTAAVSEPAQLIAPGNILQGAALMFFAFAGYARVATLGEEVRNPKKNIPAAIAVSLGLVVILYSAISYSFNSVLGSSLATTQAPFLALLSSVSPWLPSWTVIAVASLASLGSMLALLAGVSRTAAEMASDREIPKILSKRNRFGSPWIAEVAIASGAIILLQFGSIAWVIGFSSFSVLIYYAIGHLSSIRQPRSERFMPRAFNWIGIVLCLLLIFSVPGPAVPVSIAVLAAAVVTRRLAH